MTVIMIFFFGGCSQAGIARQIIQYEICQN